MPESDQPRNSQLQQPTSKLFESLNLTPRTLTLRLVELLVVAVVIGIVTRSWQPPFLLHEFDSLDRAVTSRVPFTTVGERETELARELARQRVIPVYRHDRARTEQLRLQLLNAVRQVVFSESLETLDQGTTKTSVWTDFMHGVRSPADGNLANTKALTRFFQEFKDEFVDDSGLRKYTDAVTAAMSPIDNQGLLENLQHDFDRDGGSESVIRVVTGTDESPSFLVNVSDVLLENVLRHLKDQLDAYLPDAQARHTFAYLSATNRLGETLSYDREATEKAAHEAASSVPDVLKNYEVGEVLAEPGHSVTPEDLALLRLEHKAYIEQISSAQRLHQFAKSLGTNLVVLVAFAGYSLIRRPNISSNSKARWSVLLFSIVAVSATCNIAPDMKPIALILFGITAALVFEVEQAFFVTATVVALVGIAERMDLIEFAINGLVMAGCVVAVRRLSRGYNRSDWIAVGGICAYGSLLLGLLYLGKGYLGGILLVAFSFCIGLFMWSNARFVRSKEGWSTEEVGDTLSSLEIDVAPTGGTLEASLAGVADNSSQGDPDHETVSEVRAKREAETRDVLGLNDFETALRDTGLIEPQELKHIRNTQMPKNSIEFADALTQQGKLTGYQADRVLDGAAEQLHFGNYEVLEEIGRGGMGTVYKARHRVMGRIVAMKTISPHLLASPDASARFDREIHAAAELVHPNIVTAFDAHKTASAICLVMEYVDGVDLQSKIEQDGPIDSHLAIDCLLQAAVGLGHAHSLGVLHRDVKPSNMLLTNQGNVKVLDFGIARFVTESNAISTELTATGHLLGTPAYMAPEQAINPKQADHRADIYSLGCCLFYLLHGRPVFHGSTAIERIMAHREQPIPSLRQTRRDVSQALEAIYVRMLAKSPDDRFQSMAEVQNAIELTAE